MTEKKLKLKQKTLTKKDKTWWSCLLISPFFSVFSQSPGVSIRNYSWRGFSDGLEMAFGHLATGFQLPFHLFQSGPVCKPCPPVKAVKQRYSLWYTSGPAETL